MEHIGRIKECAIVVRNLHNQALTANLFFVTSFQPIYLFGEENGFGLFPTKTLVFFFSLLKTPLVGRSFSQRT